METLAPTRLAASWDNVGLLVGSPDEALSHVLVCVDLTPDVWEEALSLGVSAVVAYHPPIFKAEKRFVAGSIAFEAARRNVAIYSPHTAFDAAPGGTDDFLADVVGMGERRPLKLAADKDAEYKLVTFVPEAELETVASSLSMAGAGVIGEYSSCSFRTRGQGTFFGSEASNPAVGSAGTLERVDEVRLEMTVPIHRASHVIRALEHAHPYETPAYDLVRIAPSPTGPGYGRVGNVTGTREEIVEKLKAALGISHVMVAGPRRGPVHRAAVGAGACGEYFGEARAAGAEIFVLGEMRHHDALAAAKAGMTIVCTLHSTGERAALVRLVDRLAHRLPGVTVTKSLADADPFTFV